MPTIRSGQVATNEVLANSLPIDMETRVFQYDPPGAPGMKIFTNRIPSKPARSTTVRWMEDEPIPYWDRLNMGAGAGTGVTSLTVDNGAYFQVGNLVKNVRTDEVIRVTNVVGNVLTVTRGYVGSAAAMVDNDWLLNLSTAEMEGDNSPEAQATLKVERTNYVQIVKTPVHITETLKAVDHYHGDELDYQRKKAGEAHARRWEEILFHGRKKEDTSTGAKPIRAAGGIDEHISTNVLDANGTLTQSEFDDWIGDCFRYSVKPGRNSKLLFASRNVINTINSWGSGKLVMNGVASQTYGMDISTYVTGFGKLSVIYHPLLESGYEGYAYLVDPDGVMYRPLRGTKLMMNIQDNDEDGQKDQYLTEATFQFALEKCFGKLYDVDF